MLMVKTTLSMAVLAAAAGLTACASGPTPNAFSPDSVPDAVKVPAGHRVALETVGIGKITYECRPKKDAPGQFVWEFVAPDAQLTDRSGRLIGKYFGPPATWTNLDGSTVTGAQVSVSPGPERSIPLQLVKANPSTGNGAFTDVTYIQRVATRNGVVPADTCNELASGTRADVTYQADYIFWKAR